MVKCNQCPAQSRSVSEELDLGSDICEIVRKYALQNAIEYDGQGKSGSVLGRVLSERNDLKAQVKQILKLVEDEVSRANFLANENGMEAVIQELESFAPEALSREKHKKIEGLKDLPGSTSKVVLRFAPNPNGPLTLGHSRGVVINSAYAEKYEGKVVLRFDDTDTRIKPPLIEAYDWIIEDYEWLAGKSPDVIIKASERMPVYLDHAEKMISEGYGYVCRCHVEEFRKFREQKKNCPCRENTISDNLDEWGAMISGKTSEGEAVVRVKTNMNLPNPALRDWPALRIQHTPHPLVGKKYNVWPLLDFQSAIEDHEQGITHIIRGKDLMDSTRKQSILYDHFGWNYPEPIYWGRVKVHEFGGFSTSGILSSINSGVFSGWEDPRLPTLRAFRRRGFDSQSLRELWREIGLTQKDISVSMQTLESFNSKILDPITERRSFVQGPIKLQISDEEIPQEVYCPLHPDGEIPGSRGWKMGNIVYIQADDLAPSVRLKDFADVKITETSLKIESEKRSDDRPIINWLPEQMARNAILVVPDGEKVNEVAGLVEDFNIEEGSIYQFERVGFAKVESVSEEIVRLIWLHK
ncbi:MAG: glutamate--tRNA ligase [Euryarchaeota archaeon]|nr:glutamate--tRNA ligase [Euryarchaeota archaeon]